MSEGSRLARLLTRRRLLLWGSSLLLVSWILHLWEVATPGVLTRSGQVKAADYLQFYVMGRLIDSEPGALYDVSAHRRESLQVLGPEIQVFAPHPNYGPQTAWVFRPLARMPFLPSLLTFTLLSAVAYGLAMVALHRAVQLPPRSGVVVGVLAAASPTFLATLRYGQLSTFALLVVACAALALLRHRAFAGGALLGLLVYKPTLLVVVVPALTLAGEWRILAGVATTALAQLGLALAVGGPAGVLEYAGALVAIALQPDSVILYPETSHSIRGFLRLLGTPSQVASAASAALTLAAAPLGAWIWRRSTDKTTAMGLLILLTLLVSPHVLTYDLLLAAVAVFTMAAWLTRNTIKRAAPVVTVALAVLYLAPFSPIAARHTSVQFSTLAVLLSLALGVHVLQPTAPLQTPIDTEGSTDRVDAAGTESASTVN